MAFFGDMNFKDMMKNVKKFGSESLNKMGGLIDNTVTTLTANLPKDCQIGDRKLKFIKQIAEGGFSYVFLVRDIMTGEDFALKRMMVHNSEIATMAKHEINVMKQLNGHPNIIKFCGSETLQGNNCKELYVLMEYASGHMVEIMNSRLQDRFTETEVLQIFTDVCHGVDHMHSQSPPIVHRDLKIENVLLSSEGRYKLCDFGSSTTTVYAMQNQKEILHAKNEIEGCTTPEYRAPEMVDVYSKKAIGEKADIWALGCVLYKLCYFITPFEQNGPLQIINGKYSIPEAPRYSHDIIDLIAFMLNPDPDVRPNIKQVIQKLCEIQKIQYSKPKVVSPKERVTSVPDNTSSNPQQKPDEPVQKTKTSSTNDLFADVEWHDESTTEAKNGTAPNTTNGNNPDDWVADFDSHLTLESKGKATQQPPTQNRSNNNNTQTSANRINHMAPPSISQSTSKNNLAQLLDWQDATTTTATTTANNTASNTRVVSPTSPHKPVTQPSTISTTSNIPKSTSNSNINATANNVKKNDLFSQLDWNQQQPSNNNTGRGRVMSPPQQQPAYGAMQHNTPQQPQRPNVMQQIPTQQQQQQQHQPSNADSLLMFEDEKSQQRKPHVVNNNGKELASALDQFF